MTTKSVLWFRGVFEKIRNDLHVENHLSEIKLALASLSLAELTHLASNVQLNVIFDCLNSSNKNQIVITCEILKTILPCLKTSIVLTCYEVALIRALCHPEKEVKEVALLELIRCVPDPELINLINREPSLLINTVKCLCDDAISVAERAINFFTTFGQNPAGLNSICHPAIKKALLDLTDAKDLYKVRLYQVIIDISVISKDALKKLDSEGLFKGLIKQLESDDVLIKMALLEELGKLVAKPHGFEFLQQKKLIYLLTKQLLSSQDDALSSLITPGLIKFFGTIGQTYPEELITSHSEVMEAVFKAVFFEDLSVCVVALETVGFIATSAKGKAMLNKLDTTYMKQILGRLKEVMLYKPIEWRDRAMAAFASIMHLEDDRQEGENLEEITQKWFEEMGPDFLSTITKMTQQPFPELKLVSMNILTELASQSWAQQKIQSSTGLLSYLLDRSTELSLEGMQAKYNIIRNLVEHGNSLEIFGEEDFERMQEYVKQGVCYVPTQTEVATERQP